MNDLKKLLYTKKINVLEEDIRYCKSSKLPLIIYGAGNFAHCVKNLLLRYSNIQEIIFCVDRGYGLGDCFVDEVDKKFKEYILLNSRISVDKRALLYKFKNAKKCILFPSWICGKIEHIERDFLEEKIDLFQDTYRLLASDYDRRIFFDYIRGYITNDVADINSVSNGLQYFEADIIKLQSNFLGNCGGYNGDTVRSFFDFVKMEGRGIDKPPLVVSFEASPANFALLKKNVGFKENVILT